MLHFFGVFLKIKAAKKLKNNRYLFFVPVVKTY